MNAAQKREIHADFARYLRERGWTLQRIGNQFGVSPPTVLRWLDPDYAQRGRDQSNAAKRRRAGVCVDCGGATKYAGKHGRETSERCWSCRKALEASEEYRTAHTYWTRERIIAAIQAWAAEHGEPPACPDWNPTGARYLGDEARALRFEQQPERTWPWFTLVVYHFGSWNAGIAAAGFEPRVPGGGKGNILRRRKAAA